MAFNPFDIFRRNQRILFAILTVVVMFMFVLQFGQGDFFSMVPKWLSSRSRGGEVLAVVGGSKVHSTQIGDLETRRLLANEYMVRAADRTLANLQKSVAENLKTTTAQNRQAIEAALTAQQTNFISRDIQQRFQFAQMGFGAPPTLDDILTDRERTIQFSQFSLGEIVNGKSPPEADRAAAQAVLASMDLSERLASAGGRQKVSYFSNQPSNTTKDNLEFLLWLKKADQLGISYTDEDVNDLVNAELYRKMANEDWKAVEDGMRGKIKYSPATIRGALADEFRVRAAQAAVMGQSALNPQAREFESPAEFFEFFRKETNPAQYKVVAVPAENFLDKVPGAPDEATRRELFQAGKNEDPNPRLARLGLREPRKLKLGWLEATGEEPYYKAAAAEATAKLDVLSKAGVFLTAPLGGVTLASLLAAPAPAYAPDLLTKELYKGYAANHRATLSRAWFNDFAQPAIPDTAFVRAPNVATLLAGLAGSLATAGSPLTAPALFTGGAVLADRKVRFDTLPPALIAPVAPGLGGLVTAFGNFAVQNVIAQPLPQAVVRGQLLSQFETGLAKTILLGNRRADPGSTFLGDAGRLSQDLAKLNAPANSPEARKLIADFAAARGLKVGESKEFRDQYTMGTDDGLKVLREKKEQSGQMAPGVVPPAAKFGRRFFTEVDRADPQRPREVPAAGFFKPQPYPNEELPLHLVWRTEEQTAEPLRDANSPEARAKTEAAWRRKQARELARKAAEDLAAKAGNLGKNAVEIDPKLAQLYKDFATQFPAGPAQDRVRTFAIDDVAPVVESTSIGIMAGRTAGAFNMTESDNIPYPTQAMRDELVKQKDKPLSTSFVLADEPTDTYYVATLVNRQEKSVDEFHINVYGMLASRTLLQPLIARNHRSELRKQARETALALLKSEFGYEKESESVNKKTADLD